MCEAGRGGQFGSFTTGTYNNGGIRQGLEGALTVAVGSARVGTLAAALCAGVSYASLVITHFRGFRQFGIIGGLGMVLSWAVAFALLPPPFFGFSIIIMHGAHQNLA